MPYSSSLAPALALSLALALAAAALSFAGCTDAPEAPPVEPDAKALVPHDQVETPPTTAFELIRDGMPGQGATGAQTAWDAGKPALLLFAASW